MRTEKPNNIGIAYLIRNRGMNMFLGLIIPVTVVILWQIMSDLGHVNQSIFTSPRDIVDTFVKMIEKGTYFKHLGVSLTRIIKGYLMGVAAGFLLGSLAVIFKPIGQMLGPLISLLRPVPPIACIPFLILWLGIGETSKVSVIIIGAFWPVLLNTMAGISNADEKLLELARAFGKDKRTILFKVILPCAFPYIFTGLRLGISNAWTCVVTAEMIAASAGVGYLISYGRELAQPYTLFVGIISIAIVGYIIDKLVIRLEGKVVYWTEPSRI